jgi:hypothetical protein
MAAEPAAKKRKLWRVVVMLFISCLLTASGVLELLSMGTLVFLPHSKLFSGYAELP